MGADGPLSHGSPGGVRALVRLRGPREGGKTKEITASKRHGATIPERCWVRAQPPPAHHGGSTRVWAPAGVRILSQSGSGESPASSLPRWGGYRPVPPAPTPVPGTLCPLWRRRRHSRDADLEQVVLDELLPQHDDAQLDAQLHQAAARGTLRGQQVREPRPEPGTGRQPREGSSALTGGPDSSSTETGLRPNAGTSEWDLIRKQGLCDVTELR